MSSTEKGRDILARTLWGEARGESQAGMEALPLDHPQSGV